MTQLDHVTTNHLTIAEAFQSFCEIEMPARNFSAQTRRGYTYDLAEWLAQAQPEVYVRELTTYTIEHYLSQLDQRGLKGSTRHRKVAAIKTFLRYLEQQHALPKDFSSSITWPEVQRDEPRALSTAEYTAILREADHHPRDSAMFELLLQTGIRLSELTALQVDDVTLPAKPSPDPNNILSGLLTIHMHKLLPYHIGREPKAVRQARLDTVALVPASLLPHKGKYQRIANHLPKGGVLICQTDKKQRISHILAQVASWLSENGHFVRALLYSLLSV